MPTVYIRLPPRPPATHSVPTMSQEDLCLNVAREIAIGKLANQRALLQHQMATVTGKAAQRQVRSAIDGIGQMIDAARRTSRRPRPVPGVLSCH